MNTIEDHTLFISIVERKSFYQAAEQLNMSASAVSRQLKKLEHSLGVQLLNRTTRSNSMTQAGKIYFDSCRRIQEEKRSTNSLLQDLSSKPVGKLKIAATPTFVHAHLLDAMSKFSIAYPDISFQLDVSDENIDIVESGIDLAIRIGELQDSRLKSRLLLQSQLIPCASSNYISSAGTPDFDNALSQHQFIYMSHLPSIEKRQLQLVPEMNIREQQKKLIINDVLSIYQAVKSGMGISVLPRYLIQKDLDSGALVELFNGDKNTSHNIFLLFSATEFMPIKVRVFIDYLVKHFEP